MINFNETVEQRCKKITETLVRKAAKYSKDTNRFHNFDETALMDSTTPEIALKGMWNKHLISVFDMIKNPHTVTVEMIDEKIGDLINYAILLEGLFLRRLDERVTPDVIEDINTAVENIMKPGEGSPHTMALIEPAVRKCINCTFLTDEGTCGCVLDCNNLMNRWIPIKFDDVSEVETITVTARGVKKPIEPEAPQEPEALVNKSFCGNCGHSVTGQCLMPTCGPNWGKWIPIETDAQVKKSCKNCGFFNDSGRCRCGIQCIDNSQWIPIEAKKTPLEKLHDDRIGDIAKDKTISIRRCCTTCINNIVPAPDSCETCHPTDWINWVLNKDIGEPIEPDCDTCGHNATGECTTPIACSADRSQWKPIEQEPDDPHLTEHLGKPIEPTRDCYNCGHLDPESVCTCTIDCNDENQWKPIEPEVPQEPVDKTCGACKYVNGLNSERCASCGGDYTNWYPEDAEDE